MPRTLAFALLLLTAATPTLAQSTLAAPRIRGEVAAFDGHQLAVKDRDGRTQTLPLSSKWAVTGVQAARLDDIKPGTYVGTAAVPAPEGTLRALEVLVFPAAMQGAGEGHRPWDLLPESTMTNATVTNTVTGVDGRTLTLSYKGGSQRVTVPDGVPVVSPAQAVPDDLKPGAPVVVLTERGSDGQLAVLRVIVGNHGIAPPM